MINKKVFLLLILFLLIFAVMLKGMAPSVFLADSAELITGAAVLAVPHSPSFPLFCLSGRLFSLLPLGHIAFRVNLASAVFLGLGALCFSWSLFSFLPSMTLLAACSLTVALCPLNWYQGIRSEVYALNLFIFGLASYLVNLGERSRWRYYFLALTAGSGLANHYLLALVFCAAFFILLLVQDWRSLLNLKTVLLSAMLILLGLSLYLYLPLRASQEPALNWNNPSGISGLGNALLRKTNRGRFFAFGLMGTRLRIFAGLYTDYLGWPGLGLILVGIVFSLYRRRAYWRALLLVNLLVALTYVGHINFRADHPDIWGYAMLNMTTGAGWLFYGLYESGRHLVQRKKQQPYLWLVALLIPLVFYLSFSGFNSRRSSFHYYDYGTNMLRTLSPGSLVFFDTDYIAFPLTYLLGVEQRRPDIVPVDQFGSTFKDYYQFHRYPPELADKVLEGTEKRLIQRLKSGQEVFYSKPPLYDYPEHQYQAAGLLYRLAPTSEGRSQVPWRRLYRERGLMNSNQDLMSREMMIDYLQRLQGSASASRWQELEKLVASLGQNDMSYHWNRGLAAYQSNDYLRAQEEYRQALWLNPVNQDLYYSLAISQYMLREYDACRTNLKLTLRLDPDHIQAQQLLKTLGQ